MAISRASPVSAMQEIESLDVLMIEAKGEAAE